MRSAVVNTLEPGFVLAERYQLERRVASGGMADIWAAEDQVLQRNVALKVMRPDPHHEELFALRFRDEALHSASLNHTNIATLFDYGEDDGVAFLVMELVDGKPLSQIIRENGPLPADQVRSVLGQCALALGVAHEAKVVHRDVKPANILVREDGLVKLTDFGISRALDASGHTRAGDLLGTPSYLSPEQALGRPATGASDLYALGIVGHEMLCGAKPFEKPTPIATAMSHIHEPPPPLPDDVPEDLAGVIEHLLAKDPLERPENARAVAIRLGLADHEIIGLALGLAQAVYGESALEEPIGPDDPTPAEPTATVAVDAALLLED
ncbi:serine/threonine protein kinase [Nocardioides agariphilus]|uniref:non-specific serine/threonine protein kinase n=1 Tax=Nocardioides agariphilus TaxID=433664 RepID=A0A930YHR3_9ACTN|nr:serine/threonine protein kinase [Nocardioides agariphilus]